jgi:hypothetical protein
MLLLIQFLGEAIMQGYIEIVEIPEIETSLALKLHESLKPCLFPQV